MRRNEEIACKSVACARGKSARQKPIILNNLVKDSSIQTRSQGLNPNIYLSGMNPRPAARTFFCNLHRFAICETEGYMPPAKQARSAAMSEEALTTRLRPWDFAAYMASSARETRTGTGPWTMRAAATPMLQVMARS